MTISFAILIETSSRTGKERVIVLCPLSYSRSPWSNEYDPPLSDGTVPSQKLRKLEVAANEAFDTYREMWVRFLIVSWLTLGTTTAELRQSTSGTKTTGSPELS